MKPFTPPHWPVSIEANNSANKTEHYSNCYGSKNTLLNVVPGYCGFTAESITINKDFVNRREPPIECNIGCNVSNLTSVKLAPLNCAYLDQSINDQAVKLRLRSEVPHLTRRDVDRERLPFYELLCEELLENGYHYAFTELFDLHQLQLEERRVAGPESALWYIPPLSEQKDKARTIAWYLAEAEAASRREDAHTVFTAYLTLGLLCKDSPDDLWLAEYFFKRAFQAAKIIKDDDGLKSAIAHRFYGRTLQERGMVDDAAEVLQEFYKVTRNKDWQDDAEEKLGKVAAVYLVENYRLRVDKCPAEYHSDRISLCREAYDIATECGDWNVLAPVWLLLGDLLSAAGRLEDALTVYQGLFDKACQIGDYVTLSKVTEALANLCRRMNKMDECIKYLQKFANSCERHGQWLDLGRACQMLGNAYDQVGDYAAALKWIKKSYNLPNMIQTMKKDLCLETVELSRIMIGVTRAHLMHDRYCKTLLQNTPPTVQTVITWKAHPKDEDKLFPSEDVKFPHISFENRAPKRNILTYAEHPTNAFMEDRQSD